MRCPVCDFDNAQGLGFCNECGGVLARPCPSCSGANPPDYGFCGHCGIPLDPPSSPVEESAAERRQLTVMFCDLVGSTALSGRLDPEDLREVIRDYQATAAGVVERYEGHVAQHLGDGLLIYFGYPKAHEDDARRAVHAGLGVVEAVAELSERLGRRGLELAVRVGIHTGPVVTGGIVGGETGTALALGQTPNVAAGLQELAEPNRVVLSAATHELVQGFFAGRPLGARMPRGTTRAIEVFEVAGESGIRSQWELALSQGLGPLIGRRREFVVLRDRFYLARDGRGQLVEITGEGGIGKSRQVHELHKAIAPIPHRWWTCRASAYARDDAFHPFLDHLADFFGLHHEDSPERKREKIAAEIASLAAPPETVADTSDLLAGLPGAGAAAPGRERIAELMLTILEGLSGERPLVLLIEDLQSADAATVELVERLVERIAAARILAVVTFRPAFRPSWPSSERVTRILLERLAEEEQEWMVEEVSGGKPLPPELLQQILEKAGGVPLFIEELTRMVLESDWLEETDDGYQAVGSPGALGIPASLRDALMARLDDPEAKEIAQLAAAFGQEVGFTVLQAISGLAAAELERRLDRLVEAELLTCSGAPPYASYSFRHALIREAAYESVLKSARPRYHKDVAQALIQFAPEIAESQPELVAEHCTRARLPERAVGYWLEAGRRALARGRCREARAQLTKGLESAEALPAGEREAQELTFRCTLATTLGVILGFDAPEVEQNCARALELCRRRGEPPERFWILGRLWAIDLTRPDLEAALVSGRRLLELAAAREDPEMLLEGHFATGGAHLFHGELTTAREHLEQALTFETNGTALAEGLVAVDGTVASRSFLALALWHLGFPDRALAESVAAIGRARRIAHPFTVAFALAFSAWLHVYRREGELMREHVEEMLGLAEKHELFLATWARFFLAVEETGGGREHRSAPEVGKNLFETSAACLLAARHAAAGELGAAMSRIEAGLETARRTGELFWEAELHRHRGEIVLARAAAGVDPGAVPEAEACFVQALATARRQEARSLELRAAMSLSRLWRSQERRSEAQQLLAVVHGSFTEGQDSADLKEAEALLATLAPC